MPEGEELVINTGPLIALTAALGDLTVLRELYARVTVPFAVCQEIEATNASRFAAAEFQVAGWLDKQTSPQRVSAFLRNALDPGEAAVIQLALSDAIETVCIDETVGRRVARLHGLKITGSLGILLRAKREGLISELRPAVERMRSHGIRLGNGLIAAVLRHAGEL